MSLGSFLPRAVAASAVLAVAGASLPALAWEPNKPIEFIVPAGTTNSTGLVGSQADAGSGSASAAAAARAVWTRRLNMLGFSNGGCG